MIGRRDLMLGALGLGALGASEALRPRHKLVLLQNGTIEKAVPIDFGGWSSETASGLVSPEQAGRLARTLYSEIISRVYYEAASGVSAMMLIAYGDTQSDLLQLHRPESCYPAVGFTVTLTRPLNLPIGGSAVLPVRRVTAQAGDRVENIIYWTRLGERLPQSGSQQRIARLENAMDGYVADGILVRCSMVGEPAESFAILDKFVPTLLQSIPPRFRPAFVGTDLTRRMA